MIGSDENVQPDRDSLLVEYQAAQDSAQHHDQLVWNITSILWASSLILLGLVLTAIGESGLEWPLTCTGLLAITLTFYLWRCVRQLRALKVQKYKRCVEIEKKLGLQQHSALKYPSGSQTTGYSLVMIFFLSLWVILTLFVWIHPSGETAQSLPPNNAQPNTRITTAIPETTHGTSPNREGGPKVKPPESGPAGR